MLANFANETYTCLHLYDYMLTLKITTFLRANDVIEAKACAHSTVQYKRVYAEGKGSCKQASYAWW